MIVTAKSDRTNIMDQVATLWSPDPTQGCMGWERAFNFHHLSTCTNLDPSRPCTLLLFPSKGGGGRRACLLLWKALITPRVVVLISQAEQGFFLPLQSNPDPNPSHMHLPLQMTSYPCSLLWSLPLCLTLEKYMNLTYNFFLFLNVSFPPLF